jgi:antitoxin component of MazEF toxin-antitoxin module
MKPLTNQDFQLEKQTMETRTLYKQGRSTVLVLPSKLLKVLAWTSKDQVSISLAPNSSLIITKTITQKGSKTCSQSEKYQLPLF